MSKKSIIIGLSILITLFVTLVSFQIFTPYFKYEKTMEEYYDTQVQTVGYDPVGWNFITSRSPYEIVRCEFDFINPEIIIIYSDSDDRFTIEFWKIKRDNVFANWDIEKIKANGTTSVSHTAFKNLVSMVKDDCNQFKKSHYKDVPEGEPTWTYIRPQTEEEIKKQAEEDEQYQQEQKEFEEYLSSLPKWQRILEDKWDNSPQEDLFLFEKAKAENSCDFIELEHIAADEITNKDFINYCMSKYQPETIEYFHWEYLTTREARHQAFKDAIKNEDSE